MTPLFVSLWMATLWAECRTQKDTVLQPKAEEMAAEDQTVTLDCHYTSTDTDVYIFWYKQDGTSRPQFILSRFTLIQELQLSDSAVYYCALRPTVTEAAENHRHIPNLFWYKQDGTSRPQFILSKFTFGQGKTEDEFKERFSSTLNPTMKSAPLKIQELQLSDSAVYYCALRPTVVSSSGAPQGWKNSKTWRVQLLQEAAASVLTCSNSKITAKVLSQRVRDRVDLQVSSAAVPDSAVYDCAVRPRVTGNPQPVYNNTAPSSWKPSSHQRAT
ncbi:hypothetical protein D4764_15G0006140 [Takifugu flavidus]|uniref:Ig-like domain-containing protein n=1 Tax=Takifugu flavidus TaxID=433684 RepID=A0A5C6P4S2_9TELE|nr:hypothetical protein D4764_15G0006140 [Takifugu flavidus]